jgi:hypothetical protein
VATHIKPEERSRQESTIARAKCVYDCDIQYRGSIQCVISLKFSLVYCFVLQV